MDGLIALAKSVKAQQAVEDAGKFLKIGVDGKVVPAAGGGGGTEIIAAEYSATETYAVGDYCIHGGGLYCCNTAIETAEEWTAEHWTETVVGDELSELKSSKADKLATVKDTTTADITVAAAANTNYIYGELTDLTVTWGTGSDNAEISFIFKSGATATTLAVSTTGAKFSSYAPSANAIVEISAKWYLDTWVVIFHETAVA